MSFKDACKAYYNHFGKAFPYVLLSRLRPRETDEEFVQFIMECIVNDTPFEPEELPNDGRVF